MIYEFLIDTSATERLKTLSMWSMFRDEDMEFRPHLADRRGRGVREQMVHQCASESLWFVRMFGIDTENAPLPERETRLEFLKRYAADSRMRLEALVSKDRAWCRVRAPEVGKLPYPELARILLPSVRSRIRRFLRIMTGMVQASS